MSTAIGSFFGLSGSAGGRDSVEAPPLVRILRWLTLVLWVVVFAAQFQAVVSGAPVQWMLLGLTTALFVGVHVQFWYEESQRGRQVHRVIDRMRGRIYEDDLTGLPNGRHFLFELRRQMMRSLRDGRGFAIALAEVRSTDEAQPVDDDLLKTLARALGQALDASDFLARLRASSFAAIIHDDDDMLSSQKASVVGEVLVAAIPLERLTTLQPAVSVTCYEGESQIRAVLQRVQDDFTRARRVSLQAGGARAESMALSQAVRSPAA